MSFSGYLIQAKPPLNVGEVLRFTHTQTLNTFITFLKLEVHFLTVFGVIILAPPMKFTPATQVSGGILLHGDNTKIK